MLSFVSVLPPSPRRHRRGHHRYRRHGRQGRGDLCPLKPPPARSPASEKSTCCTGVRPVGLPGPQFAVAGGERLSDFTAAGIVPGSGDDRLRSQTVKWVSDGSNQGYTGFMRQNYLGRDTRGVANFTPEQLARTSRPPCRQGGPSCATPTAMPRWTW